MYCSGSKSLTSAAILVEYSLVSKWVMGPTPETPSTRLDQTVSRSFPMGVTNPRPVTATRRPFTCVIGVKRTDRRSKHASVRCGNCAVRVWTWGPTHRRHGKALRCCPMVFADHEEEIAAGLVLQEATIAAL